MSRRRIAVLWGVAAVVGGGTLLHWFHASARAYGPADPAYETAPISSNVPMLVLYAAIAVTGVCLASVGWWRPFLAGVALAYLVPLVGGHLVPLLGEAPDRLSTGGLAAVEAALLAAPTWLTADRSRAKAKHLPIPSRLALPRRDQHALPRAKHV